jgi:ABC-type glycerol-3-phosphate transport system substrate-binding protein
MIKLSLLAAVAMAFGIGTAACGGVPTPPADPSGAAASAATTTAGTVDKDGDGIPDATDKCPAAKEDGLAPDPKDGCPSTGK